MDRAQEPRHFCGIPSKNQDELLILVEWVEERLVSVHIFWKDRILMWYTTGKHDFILHLFNYCVTYLNWWLVLATQLPLPPGLELHPDRWFHHSRGVKEIARDRRFDPTTYVSKYGVLTYIFSRVRLILTFSLSPFLLVLFGLEHIGILVGFLFFSHPPASYPPSRQKDWWEPFGAVMWPRRWIGATDTGRQAALTWDLPAGTSTRPIAGIRPIKSAVRAIK